MEQDREKENVAPGIEEGRPTEKIRPLSEDERLTEQIRQAEQEDAARKKRLLTAFLGLIACVAVFVLSSVCAPRYFDSDAAESRYRFFLTSVAVAALICIRYLIAHIRELFE